MASNQPHTTTTPLPPPFNVALIQLNTQDDLEQNLTHTTNLIEKAARQGAELIVTPEMTGRMGANFRADSPQMTEAQRKQQYTEADDPTLRAYRELAQRLQVHLLIGSLAVKAEGNDGRLANRSYLLTPTSDQELATTAARYDKCHMFDITLDNGENYAESNRFKPGDAAVAVDTKFGRLGLSICYDLRFPHLYRTLAQAGAHYLTIPSAFTQTTGKAHWHVLCRARAIETGCYVFAAAQGGQHPGGRQTYGHSLIVNPWGEIIAELEHDKPDVLVAEINPQEVLDARKRIPAWNTNATFALQPIANALGQSQPLSSHPFQMSDCPPMPASHHNAAPIPTQQHRPSNSNGSSTSHRPTLKVYFNQTCSKCKGVMQILSANPQGANVILLDYMQHVFTREELLNVAQYLNVTDGNAQELLRPEADKVSTLEEAINILCHKPELLQRPLVVDEQRRKGVIARPPEKILELLDVAQ